MPLSPLTRLLTVLTLLTFPWVFVTMMEPRSWLAPGLLGIALSLWTAALFGIVKSGAAFDERAFHPTRPRGRQQSFVRSSLVMLVIVVAVSLMAALRGWHLNLGWRAIWGGALITFTLLFLFTAAVATGFNLTFTRARATRWVGWIMVALPLIAHLVVVEVKDKPAWPGAAVFTSWTLNFSPAVMTAAALYGFAWWLTVRFGRWWLGLTVCGIAGLSLVGGKGARSQEPALASLPTATVDLKRLPLVDAKGGTVWATRAWRSFDLIDFLPVAHLGKDEILGGSLRLPFSLRTPEDDLFVRRFGTTNRFHLLQWQRSNLFDTDQKDAAWVLASQLPSSPEVEGSFSPDTVAEIKFNPDNTAAILKQLNESTWNFDGHIHRIVHQCEVPLLEGGPRHLKPLGHARFRPAFPTNSDWVVPYRLTFPSPSFDPDHRTFSPTLPSYALMVNRSGTAAVKSDAWYQQNPDDGGLASQWKNSTFKFPLNIISKWPASEVEGASIHLFTIHPVAAVNMTLPPPEQ